MEQLFTIIFVLIGWTSSILCEIVKNQIPISKQDVPLVVETMISIEEISSLNLKELEFSMIFLQEQFWDVKRLFCDPYLNKLKINSTELIKDKKLSFNKIYLNDLWTPNSYITDVKDFKHIPEQNEVVEISIDNNHCHFNLKTRINVKIGCKMNFKNYPNDIQICPVRFTSYTYKLDFIYYKWREPGLITKELIEQINQYSLKISKLQYNASKEDDSQYSFLKIILRFENHLNFFIMQIVCPTYFIISIVYLNFWMKPDGSPGRFLLTILTFLSLVTIYTGNRDKLPALAYVNALDIWMIGNMFFVFCAISELVIITFISKNLASKQKLNNVLNFNRNLQFQKSNNQLSAFTISTHDTLNKNTSFAPDIITLNNNFICDMCKDVYFVQGLNTNQDKNLNNEFNLVNTKHKKLYNLDLLFRMWYPIFYFIYNLIFWILLLNREFETFFMN